MRFRLPSVLLVPLLSCAIHPVRAQTPSAGPSPSSQNEGFLHRWLSMVSRTQAEQPHWVTPVATTTPRLEQEFRYDIFWQPSNTGITTENFGGGKGLELIPQRHIEIILVAPPAFIVHNNPAVRDGFGDWSFLVKYRIAAANEERGNYILTAFLQVTFPTAQFNNGATNTIITPTIAYGKGIRKFDLQGTFGVTLPTANAATIGQSFLWNNAFQYHLYRKFWPEVEVNFTHFQNGPNDGKTQVFLTPGILFGKFHLWKRLGLSVGGGFQIAATRFHVNNHNRIFTVRFPF
jgi:hypothetical protein